MVRRRQARPGGGHQGAGGEVIQGQGVVLKGAVQIRLARVTGIAGLGEEGQVRQVEGRHQVPALGDFSRRRAASQAGMYEGQGKQEPAQPQGP